MSPTEPLEGVYIHSLFLPPEKVLKHCLLIEGFLVSWSISISALYFLNVSLMEKFFLGLHMPLTFYDMIFMRKLLVPLSNIACRQVLSIVFIVLLQFWLNCSFCSAIFRIPWFLWGHFVLLKCTCLIGGVKLSIGLFSTMLTLYITSHLFYWTISYFDISNYKSTNLINLQY